MEFNLFGSSYGIGSGKFEGEATFTDTTFKMGAGNDFLTGTWALKDGAVVLNADDGAKDVLARSKTTTVGNFPSSTAQLQNKIRVSLQSTSTYNQPYNFAYIQANGPKSVVITGAQNRQANCTKD